MSKYPRNPIKRQPMPASGGTYTRKNGKLEKLNEPGQAPVNPTTTKSTELGGSKKKED